VPAAAIVDIVVREVLVPWRKEQIADAGGLGEVPLRPAGARTAARS